MSTLAVIAIEQSSAAFIVGFPPKLHSVKLSIPPPSQSNEARGWVASPPMIIHISKPAAVMLVHSSEASDGSPPFAHSVALSAPPPSQSNIAIFDIGKAVIYAQISMPAAARDAQS